MPELRGDGYSWAPVGKWAMVGYYQEQILSAPGEEIKRMRTHDFLEPVTSHGLRGSPFSEWAAGRECPGWGRSVTLKRGVGGQPGTSGLSVLEHFRLAGILQGLRSLWQLMRQLCVPQQLSLHGRQSAPVSAVAVGSRVCSGSPPPSHLGASSVSPHRCPVGPRHPTHPVLICPLPLKPQTSFPFWGWCGVSAGLRARLQPRLLLAFPCMVDIYIAGDSQEDAR